MSTFLTWQFLGGGGGGRCCFLKFRYVHAIDTLVIRQHSATRKQSIRRKQNKHKKK